MAAHFPLKLIHSRALAPSIHHFVFRRDDGEALAFIPGQFIQIHFSYPDGSPTKRSYSIATVRESAQSPDDPIEVAVSYVPGGAASELFGQLREGQQIDASGPFGRFCLMPADANRRYLLIATGTGVTPYRAMLPLLRQAIAERGVEVVLLFGARSPVELLYGEEFAAFAKANPGFRFIPCFSREPALDDAYPEQRRGYVQDALASLAPDPEHDLAYLCGNPDMVDSAFEMLKSFALPVPHIRREKYVSSR